MLQLASLSPQFHEPISDGLRSRKSAFPRLSALGREGRAQSRANSHTIPFVNRKKGTYRETYYRIYRIYGFLRKYRQGRGKIPGWPGEPYNRVRMARRGSTTVGALFISGIRVFQSCSGQDLKYKTPLLPSQRVPECCRTMEPGSSI